MPSEKTRKIEAVRAVRYLAAVLYRLSRIESVLQEQKTSRNDAAPPSAADPMETLRLCAAAKRQLYIAEKVLE
jgi:hypothetical protein